MNGLVLVLRPEPGAGETAERARQLGLEPVKAPLFAVRPLAWTAPDGSFDAVLFTSAHAARLGGPQLEAFRHLRCIAVGEATAAAARAAGFGDVRIGAGDGAAALAEVPSGSGVLHFAGRDHLPLQREGVAVVRRIVYAADAADGLPAEARRALAAGALALIHSPRAGTLFGTLVDRAGLPRPATAIAAISEQAAAAAGPGWRAVAAAARPRDEALLELAAALCQTRAGRVRE